MKRHGNKKFVNKKRLRIFLFVLGGVLLFTAAVIFIVQWKEGKEAEKTAQALLDESGIEPDALLTQPDSGISPAETQGVYEQSESPGTDSEEEIEETIKELEGYTVIARIDIEVLDVHLPILSATSDKALKVSVCYYSGPEPGEEGNLVITGHNYRNGAHFGRLDEVEEGAKVSLTDLKGNTYNYTVYMIEHIKPDEEEKLDNTKYLRELTLLTCEARGNRRLVVRCKPEG